MMYFQPRDQYLSKLLSRLQLSDKDTVQSTDVTSDDTVESWEALDDNADQVYNLLTICTFFTQLLGIFQPIYFLAKMLIIIG